MCVQTLVKHIFTYPNDSFCQLWFYEVDEILSWNRDSRYLISAHLSLKFEKFYYVIDLNPVVLLYKKEILYMVKLIYFLSSIWFYSLRNS